MNDGPQVKRTLEKISKNIEEVNKKLQDIVPKVFVKEASVFGNSAHIVLSKELLNKKVGVIVLQENLEKNKRR
jgi:putative transposon-encoded protein